MSTPRELSQKIIDIRGNESLEELLPVLRDNFDTVQRILDVLTGQRVEDRTPVTRDCSVAFKGDIKTEGGELVLGTGRIRVTSGKKIEYSSDGVIWARLPDNIGHENDILAYPLEGGVPQWKDPRELLGEILLNPSFSDATASRALGTVYQNDSDAMRVLQISVTLVGA